MSREKLKLVYMGAFVTIKNRLAYRYGRVVNGAVENELTFKKKLTTYAGVGCVYRYESSGEEGATIIHGPGERAGDWPDRGEVERWQIEHQAARDEHATLSSAKAAGKERLDIKSLERWREAYQRASSVRRNLILLRAVQYITRGK